MQTIWNDFPSINPIYGNTLKVLVESCNILKYTGVSLVLLIYTVWYTLSLGPHGGKKTLFYGLILIIGIKGWLPGGKECPTNLKFMHIGGSSSSVMDS